MNEHRNTAMAAIMAAAEAADAKGVPSKVFADTLVEAAMTLVAATEGGMEGLANWHRMEARTIMQAIVDKQAGMLPN